MPVFRNGKLTSYFMARRFGCGALLGGIFAELQAQNNAAWNAERIDYGAKN